MSNYATKTGSRRAAVDSSSMEKKSDLTSLKVEVDKIDADKLKTVPVDLSKVSNVVNNDVVKKIVYNKEVAKVNNNDSGGFLAVWHR